MKPILFKTEMVKAVLNTKPGVWPAEPIDPDKPFKWQTRRVIKDIDKWDVGCLSGLSGQKRIGKPIGE